jgi:hypothetical protein
MLRRLLYVAILVLLSAASGARAFAGILYGATGSQGVNGQLFTLNPATGAVITTVGNLRLANGAPVGMTGMAFDPNTGILYGSTANASPNIDGHLVIIDPNTAIVTDIGDFSVASTFSDITFDPTTGILYGWEAAGGHQLHIIDKNTGAAVAVGTTTFAGFGGGGLAASLAGTLFSTPDGSTADPATLRTVNKVTGVFSSSVNLSGQPLASRVINSLDFDENGVLFGVNGQTATHLVTINTATGVVTDIGRTPDNTDAIAFLRQNQPIPEPATLVIWGIGALGLGIGFRRRKSVA